MEEIETIKETSKIKNKFVKFGGLIVIAFIFTHFVIDIGYFFDNFSLEIIILIEMGISLVIVFIIFLLEKLGIIKPKSKEEVEKEKKEEDELVEEKKIIDNLSIDELRKRFLKEEELKDYIEEKIDKEDGDRGTEWVFKWVGFGLVVFFVALLFLGSLDGVVFSKERYVNDIDRSFDVIKESLKNVVDVVINAINDFIIKFYDLGASRPRVFYSLWVITIIWWMGYMFLYKMFKESYLTIKEMFYPVIKKIYKKIIGLRRKEDDLQ